MSVFICWVLFPALFCLLSLGCGLLVRWISADALPGVLLLPIGYATIVVASQVTTFFSATTFLATPLVIALAVVGLAMGTRALSPVPSGLWPLASGLATFALYAAPVVLSGSATFLGYTLLGDTSIHLTLIDWVMSHGFHTVPSGPPSSTHAALAGYIGTAYPLGAHTALGAVRPLVGQDVAWIFQPYMAVLAAFAALSIYAILDQTRGPRWLIALGAFLSVSAGLVYAYALEASVKEIATICVIPMLVAVGADYVNARGGVRRVIPLAVATGAGVGILNASILVWLGPILLAVLVGVLLARGGQGWRQTAVAAGAFLAIAALLSFPSLWVVSKFIHDTTNTFTGAGGSDFGNLLGPLDKLQALGIWPMGDFRLALTSHVTPTHILMAIEGAGIVIGLVWAIWRRTWWPLVFLAASLIGWAYVSARSSPWGDAKALMIVSPAIVATAIVGAAFLWQSRWRPASLLIAAAVTFGVLWTDAVAYHDLDLAPRDRLAELGTIGHRFAGQGPALYTEFEEFGKHFLRQTDPSGSDEAWQDAPRATLAAGGAPPFGQSVDIDQLTPGYVQHFRTLVLRRSGAASRPPADYRLAYTGRFYEVWQRTPGIQVARHLGLGTPTQPGAVPKCAQVRQLAAGATSRIAFVERPQLPVFLTAKAKLPRFWGVDGTDPTNVRPYGAGTLTGRLDVPAGGRYTVWIQGSFGRPTTVRIDGRRVGSAKHELNPRGQYARLGQVTLSPGAHSIQIARGTGNLYPGDGGRNRLIGPVVLDPSSDTRTVKQLPASRWRDLCGRSLDWVEAIR